MDLAEIIGTDAVHEIQKSGQMVFHSVGDTGAGRHEDLGDVVNVMAMDFHRTNPADRPAVFMHLGDVCYNLRFNDVESKRDMYEPQFYLPYGPYPGKIVAIPGNHDSNPEEDAKSINAFEDNFCAPPPKNKAEADALLNAPKRTPMHQPGTYYRLDMPFAQVIAVFSNGGEQEGIIRGDEVGGDHQFDFLVTQLKAIKSARDDGDRRALLIAVHHPPYSGGGGHSGSTTMNKALDEAYDAAHILPDAVISGHSHVYQRFTREMPSGNATAQIPYVVAGNGGHNITPLKQTTNRKHVVTPVRGHTADGKPSDHVLQQYFNGFGHLIVTVTNRILTIDCIGTHTNSSDPIDTVTVDLATSRISHESDSLTHPVRGEVDFRQ